MKRWGLATLIVVIAVGVGSFLIIRWATAPSTTTSSSVENESPSGVLGTSNTLVTFTSPHFTIQMPRDLQIKTSNENPNGAIAAGYLFTNIKPSVSDQVAITVGKLDLSRLSETSGVKQRLNNPDAYEPVTVSGAPEGALSFKRKDGYETAVFWQQDSNYVALVVSGQPQRRTELDQTLQSILHSWAWQ